MRRIRKQRRHEVASMIMVVLICPPLFSQEKSATSFDPETIMAHVRVLADKALLGRRAGTEFELRAANYVAAQLDKISVLPVGETRIQEYAMPKRNLGRDKGSTSYNVLGVIQPPENSTMKDVVVIGAHLDHVGSAEDGGYFPGADDNASGVAVVLEVARELQKNANQLKRPIVVAFFGAEEQGLIGSRQFLETGPVDRNQIRAMINIDMIGRPLMDQKRLAFVKRTLGFDSDRGIGVIGTKGRPAFSKVVRRTAKESGVTTYGTQAALAPILSQLARNRSDHACFERVGIPTLFFGSGESDDYHKQSDTIDKIRPDLMAQRADFTYRTAVALATLPIEDLPPRENANIPSGKRVSSIELSAGELTILLQDNANSPKSLSGLQSLMHTSTPDFDAFDPDTAGASAGLNFEHIISGHRSRNNKFTPRRGKLELYAASAGNSATLVRMREDSRWDESSTLNYAVKAPHYVDFEFRCSPRRKEVFGKRGHATHFFANYMNDVKDPAIHFLGVDSAAAEEKWIRGDAPKEQHADWNGGGTYRHAKATSTEYDDDVEFRLNSWSYEYPRFTKPFYYGRAANNMVFMLMFDKDHTEEDEIRFSLFKFKLPKLKRPAWDFQYVIHKVVENRKYGFRGRLVWKPWVSKEDCLREYESWHLSLNE